MGILDKVTRWGKSLDPLFGQLQEFGVRTTGVGTQMRSEHEARKKRKRDAAEARAAAGRELEEAGAEEDRLREAVISRLGAREKRIEDQRGEMLQDLSAAQGRAATQAYGRQAGRASGGGKLAALSGVEMDIERAGREIHRQQDEKAHEAAMDKLSFERGTMKTKEQLRDEAREFGTQADQLVADASTLGFLNASSLNKSVEEYIEVNGLDANQASRLRTAVDTSRRKSEWF